MSVCARVCVCALPLHNTSQQCYDCIISSMPHVFLTGSVTWGFAHLCGRLHEWVYSAETLIHVCVCVFVVCIEPETVPGYYKLLTSAHYWPLTLLNSERLGLISSLNSLSVQFTVSPPLPPTRASTEAFKKWSSINVESVAWIHELHDISALQRCECIQGKLAGSTQFTRCDLARALI